MGQNLFRFKQFDLYLHKDVMPLTSDAILLGSWANVSIHSKSCLDIGTGTGVLSLMMAQRFSQSLRKIVAIDIDKKSVELASLNFQKSPWSTSMSTYCTAVQDFSPSYKFDCIICNPPFFEITEQATRAVMKRSKHEDLLDLETLVVEMDRLTHERSKVSLILPWNVYHRLKERHLKSRFEVTRECHMVPFENAPVKRMLVELKKAQDLKRGHERDALEKNIIMYNTDKTYNQSYKELTSGFYI